MKVTIASDTKRKDNYFMKRIIPYFFILILAILVSMNLLKDNDTSSITTFEECVAAGNPVMESYPRQCRANEQTFVEEIEGIAPYDSGVEGVVSLGPTCPVMGEGDDSCMDKSYQTTINIFRSDGTKSLPFVSVESNKDGRYKAMLPPGDYVLWPQGGDPLPYCSSQGVTIRHSEIIEVNFSCDTGIR